MSSSTPSPARVPRLPRTSGPGFRGSLQLVPPPTHNPHRSPLALWHLLSLDAPTVATLWTLFIARCSHLTLPWTAAASMFAAVWMIYAADRLLDARLLDTTLIDVHHHPDLEARHRFHHRHRTRFLAVILLDALALTILLRYIGPRSLHLYVLLATILAAWMLLIHIRPSPNDVLSTPRSPETRRRPRATRLPKELAVGIFFPAAIFIPTLARISPSPAAVHFLGWTAFWLRPAFLPSAILFACVCTLNCLCLYAWEHPAPRTQAHWTTRWATTHLTHLAIVVVAAATLTAALYLPQHALTTGLPALACALSAAALLSLNHLRHRLSPIHLRAAADLVLLTPLFLLPFAR